MDQQEMQRAVMLGIERQQRAEAAGRGAAIFTGFALWIPAFGVLLSHDRLATTGTVLAALIGPPIIGAIVGIRVKEHALRTG